MAMGAISLFPPIAAYVALIGNPRISFAFRMNEYEAQQVLAAQKLRSDLRVIGSDIEESLSEPYRIQVEPREHEDAETPAQTCECRTPFRDYGL